MGLSLGDHGVKTHLKNEFPQAFRCVTTLKNELRSLSADRVSVIVDGNVLFCRFASRDISFDAFVDLVYGHILDLVEKATCVVVAFDEPEHVSIAKAKEQEARDMKRTSIVASSDLDSTPSTDAYCLEDLKAKTVDIHKLMFTNRKARSRFIDAVAMEVYERFDARQTILQGMGYTVCTAFASLCFDGIDSRGGDRPLAERRLPRTVESGKLATHFRSVEHPIGEGDIKLAVATRRFIEAGMDHVYLETTDTDSIAIQLMEAVSGSQEGVCITLAMRENKYVNKKTGIVRPAYYTLCDIPLLASLVCERIIGRIERCHARRLHCMRSLVFLFCLAGCDFVCGGLPALKGRADVAMETMQTYYRERETAQSNVWNLDDQNMALANVSTNAEELVTIALSVVSKKKTLGGRKSLVGINPVEFICKGVWCLAYWSNLREYDPVAFGFASSST